MFLSIKLITKEIQILHHVTALGGNIAHPENVIAAFSDLSSNPLAVRLDPYTFVATEEFNVPSWNSITAITNLVSITTTIVNARNTSLKFRSIIAIPPLLTKTAIAPT